MIFTSFHLMKTIRILFAATLLGSSLAHAQVVSTVLSGVNRITLPGLSDTVLACPFTRPEAAAGLVLSASENVVTFKGAPGWSVNQFVTGGAVTDHFYLLIVSGPKEGAAYAITGNNSDSVTLDLDGDSLTGLAAGHRLSIVPQWTLATLFPGGGGVHVSPTPGDRQSEVLFPNVNATGINSSPSRTFYLWEGSWREVGQGEANRDHEVVYPDTYFIVRHNIATATEFVGSGQIVSGKLRTWLGVNAAAQRDNYLALQRPSATTLAASGLVESGAFAASPTPGNRTDELLVFDNTVARRNRAPSATYYYWDNAWRKIGAGSASFDGATILQPGVGFIIRKGPAATAPTWTNSPNY